MPTYLAPGVFVEEISSGARPIAGVSTSTAAFIGVAERGPVGRATLITGFAEFVKRFGGPIGIAPGVREHYLYYGVRHFFELGGSRCYVVRVAHYTDINNTATLQAQPAERLLDAQQLNGTVAAGAVRVRAITPGTWGTALQVSAASTSSFSLPLGQAIAAGNFDSIVLPANTDVVPGTLLQLVHEITGVVTGVVSNPADPAFGTLTFAEDLLEGGAPSTATLTTPVTAFKPDFSLMTVTNHTTAVDLNANNPPIAAAQLRLASVTGLNPGDSIHFVVAQALVVVLAIEATTIGLVPAMRAVIAPAAAPVALPTLPLNRTRVYARDFALQVRLNGDVIETIPNLSLVAAHPRHVDKVLGEDAGGSQYITAVEPNPLASDLVVMRNTAFANLAGAANDGLTDLSVSDFVGSDLAKNGLRAFDAIEDASILVIGYSRLTPTGSTDPAVNQRNLTSLAIAWVETRKDMFYIIDPPRTVAATAVADVRSFRGNFSSSYAGIYFSWIEIDDPFTGLPVIVPPSGAVAGIFARSDGQRGVHKAPAGFDVGILSVATGLAHNTTRGENDVIYPEKINAIRNFPEGIVVWGSRTISADPLWEQVSIRRLFIFIERSIQLGTGWVVFEPNDQTLWKSIERSVRGFLRVQWREGKLFGATEEEAFFVRCNEETNPPEVVDAGMVVTEIGVSPSRPAEFVVFRIFQFAGRER
jgi:phage tail sheath protein FI